MTTPTKTSKTLPFEMPTRAPQQLGQAIGRYRAKMQLSQAALAKSAGVRQATISKVEKGIGTTELETIFAVCAALGLEVVVRPRSSKTSQFRPGDFF